MKKMIMRQYCRIQQSRAVVSLVFWTTTLTLITDSGALCGLVSRIDMVRALGKDQ